MSDTLNLDLSVREREVELVDPGTGRTDLFVLREVDGINREQFQSDFQRRSTGTPQGKDVKITKPEGMMADLICRCMFRKKSQDDGSHKLEPVPVLEVQKFPARVVEALFMASLELCGLSNDAEDDAKNE